MQQSNLKVQWFLEKIFSLPQTLEIRSCNEISDTLRELYFYKDADILIDGKFLPSINIFQYFNKIQTPIVTFIKKDDKYYAVKLVSVTTDEISCLENGKICVETQNVISHFVSLYLSNIL